MYDTIYLHQRVATIDSERRDVLLERARIAREHPERIAPRRTFVRRLLRGSFAPGKATADATVAAPAVIDARACATGRAAAEAL
ncbi:hypothetical protein JF550_03240 [Microbacterium esteraromaticum]|uniref:Uncharacterized protein n=1 Tax=Microbacterium esteraromaticum TaxID=57043 RepID=A0A939IUF4_9MICO|nr:hypothetical protein [Microbacterium esteraromaticum]MBN8204969.1 hypothetical protein [Microbacterium esteraromaticum]MBN8415123.1 hypothetical protein [Microbacterium esteraromaticum]